MNYEKSVSLILRKFREKQKNLKYTDVYMAQRMGIKFGQNYKNIISGKTALKMTDCLQLMEILGISELPIIDQDEAMKG